MKQLFLSLLLSGIVALYLSNHNESQCAENLQDIAKGLEMHSCPSGRYPFALSEVIASGCLKTIPTCPAAGYETYSASYQSTMTPDSFTLYCQGYHHGSVRLMYTAEKGLLRKPVP